MEGTQNCGSESGLRNLTSDHTAAGEDRASWALLCETPEKNGDPGAWGPREAVGLALTHQLFSVRRLVSAHILETQV